MSTFAERILAAEYFEGEFELIEEEFCGAFRVALVNLPPVKRDRLDAYLAYAPDLRKAAVEAVRQWANRPIAAALDRLRNPDKAVAKAAPGTSTMGTLEAWLEQGGDL